MEVSSDTMKLLRLSSVYFLMAIPCLGAGQTGSKGVTGKGDSPSGPVAQDKDARQAAYEAWIRGYRAGPLAGAIGDQHEIKLKVTVVEGDDLLSDPKTASVIGPLYRAVFYGCAVSTDGTVSYFHRSAMSVKGSGPSELTSEESERLDQLIGGLPDDDSKLPPPGHRIVLQVVRGNQVQARVYDRANAPQIVLEILRLTHSQIRPLTLDFPAEKKWPLTEFSETGIPSDAIGIRGPDVEESTILAISRDRYLTVRQVLHDTPAVTITDTNPSNLIRTLREAQVGDRHIGITHAEFTLEGRYLLLLTTLPAVRIYDTKNWQQVPSLPDLPPAAVSYFPSSNWKHGIFVNAAGDVALWDAESRTEVAGLDTDGKLFGISFSPDDSMFATTTGHQNKNMSSTFHLRIWSTATGELIHELRPFEQTARDDIGDPIWWPDGKYLLATVRDNPMGSNHDIGIWSVRSGRFRGEFSGCVYSSDPLSLVLHDHKLFERCRDGMILMWNAASAMEEIAQFENSLTRESSEPIDRSLPDPAQLLFSVNQASRKRSY